MRSGSVFPQTEMKDICQRLLDAPHLTTGVFDSIGLDDVLLAVYLVDQFADRKSTLI